MSKIVQVDQSELLRLRAQEFLLSAFVLVYAVVAIFTTKYLVSKLLLGAVAVFEVVVIVFKIKPWVLIKGIIAAWKE